MQFPIEASSGNYIPESAPKVGHAFPLSAWRKVHPRISPQSGMHFPNGPSGGNYVPLRRQIPRHTIRDVHDKPRPNIRASVQAEAYKVHREFRTQRRPLNVAFVLRRTVEQGTSCPDAREDVTFRKMGRPPSAMGATPPTRPFWRLQPCCPDPPWWDDPSRQPSCRAAS